MGVWPDQNTPLVCPDSVEDDRRRFGSAGRRLLAEAALPLGDPLPDVVVRHGRGISAHRSVNGFWASIGPHLPQTAYAAAKFAVKGFTEALITDLRINAPHIKCSVVMPGHIGTSIPLNTRKVQSGNQADAMDATQLAQARARFASMGRDASAMSDDEIRQRVAERERRFREEALTNAAEAAKIILNGVKADQWRILVGPDAHKIDELVRRSPERPYDVDFFERLAREVGWRLPT